MYIYTIAALTIPVAALVLRCFYLIYKIMTSECSFQSQEESLRTVLCIGSGGHTTELLRLMKNLDPIKYSPRLYILADNDTSSESKILALEKELEASGQNYSLCRIPRSRNVKQSYLTSIGTTLNATLCTVPVVYRYNPEVIFCNGPGTCVPVCVIAFLLRCLCLGDCRIVFIESVCRVRTLSLTGNILKWFADVFVVQWPYLINICTRAKYFGRLA